MDSTLQEAFDRWEASFNALCRYLEDASTPTPASTPAITTDGVVGPAPASSSTAKLVAASPTPARHSLDQGTPAPDLAPTPAALTPTMKAATSCIPMSPTRCSMGGLDHNTDMDDPMASCLLPGSAPTPSPRPWLEPVPPHPPDPWSLFPGAWSGSRPEACITVHSAVNTVLLCNNTEEVPTYKVPQHEAVQRQPWPPPSEFCENLIRDELKVIFANAASFGVQHCSSNDPRGTTLAATLESQMLQPIGNLSSSVSCILAKVQYRAEIKWNFNALLLRVQEWAPKLQCVQHVRVPSYAPSWHEWHTTDILLPILVNGSVLTLLRGSPHSFRVADLLERANQLKCTKRAQSLTGKLLVEVGIRQNIEAKQPDSTPGLFLDHHSRLRSVIIGVLLTWLDFSGIQILPVASKKVNLRTDPISLQRYNSSTTCTCFGVGVFNAILLQNWLLSQFIGQTNQWGFELLQWKTARSHQWKCSEIANAELKDNLFPDVFEEIIQATFIIVCYWAASVVDCSVFSTRFRYNLLPGTWRSRLLCVRSVCAAVHTLVFPHGKHNRSWQRVQPVIGCDALLPIIQSIVCKDYWWLTSAILTEIVSIFCARLRVQMEVICSVQTKLLLDHAYLLNSLGREQVPRSSHKGCVMVLCHIPVHDSMVEWHISMHTQCLFIGVMHMGSEIMPAPNKFSSSGSNLTFFSNSETPRWDLLVASSELMWFYLAFAGGLGTFQGGRHMPLFYQHMELRLSRNPGGATASCGQASIPVITVTTFLEQVSAGHKYYFDSDEFHASISYHLGASFHWDAVGHDSNLGYFRDPDQIKEHRLQWDPGGFFVASAWGQAEFQGGRDVRILSYGYLNLGLPLGPQRGPGPVPTITLHIAGRRQRSDHPVDHERRRRRRLFLLY